jgi:DNA-binding Lrp family transcriptional regulator
MVSRDVEPTTIDRIDHSVLHQLVNSPSSSFSAMARKVGLSPSTFQYRVAKLKERRVLAGQIYGLNYARGEIFAYRILIGVRGVTPALKKRFLAYCSRHKNILSMTHCIGGWDFEISVELERPEEISEISRELYEFFGADVDSLRVLPRFDSYKWNTYPFTDYDSLALVTR